MRRTIGLSWVFTALVAGAIDSQAGAATAEPAPRPHIVLIVADDLGFKDVGFHGSEIATPNLDRLAAAGARLEQFYVQPVCSPTRAALMTGRYPMRYGLQVGVVRPWADYGLPLEERTLAAALKQAGYHTVITGKWHLGAHDRAYLPRQRGFDHQYGHYLGAIDYFTHERMGGLDWHRNGRALREEGYSTTLIGREAAGAIERHDPATPLFLYVPFNAPHGPLQVPEAYLQRYRHMDRPKRRKFAAMVTCMDEEIGRILAALEARKMRDDTLILFFSDNGGPLGSGADNGDLRGGKGTLYEGGLRVPALAAWAGRIRPGSVVDGMLHVVDLYPTLLELAGAPLAQPLPIDGRDTWPTIAAGKPSPRDEILHQQEPTRAAIRVGNWKLVVNGGRRSRGRNAGSSAVELFDIASDPREQHDLAGRQPDRVEQLKERLERYARQAVAPRSTGRSRQPPGFVVPKVWGEMH